MREGRRSRVLGKVDETERGGLARKGKCMGCGGDRRDLGSRSLVPKDTEGRHQV